MIVREKPVALKFSFTQEHIKQIAAMPHLIGHLVGKTLLTAIHSQWIWEVWGGPEGEHTALQAHRGGYKTTAITEVGCIWWLLFHPDTRIALIRETFTAANETLKAIKQYMQTPAIKALFHAVQGAAPKAKISKDGTVTYQFKKSITKEGSIDAYGIEAVPTGSHYDRILTDDIITINSRLSKAKRERVKEGVREIITNIIDPGKTCMFVGTPWHHEDAWTLKTEEGERVLPTPYMYTPAETGILSDEEIAKKKRQTTKALYAINYDLDTNVRDDGQIFEDPTRGTWDDKLPAGAYYGHLDAKFDGKDTNALTIMARRKDGKIQCIGWTFPEHIEEKYTWVRGILNRYRCSKLWIETNPDKGFVAKAIQQVARGSVTVFTYHEDMNKHNKIVSYLKHYWADIVFADTAQEDYMLQICDYRQDQHPMDCPDSAASLLARVFYPKDPQKGRSALNDFS